MLTCDTAYMYMCSYTVIQQLHNTSSSYKQNEKVWSYVVSTQRTVLDTILSEADIEISANQ